MPYKEQIKKGLQKNKWEIVEIDSNSFWWDDEHWKICLKFTPTVYFYLCFIVDPHFEGYRKKGQGIMQIKAVSQFPKNRNDDSTIIATLNMTTGKFDKNLKSFMNQIDNFKINNNSNLLQTKMENQYTGSLFQDNNFQFNAFNGLRLEQLITCEEPINNDVIIVYIKVNNQPWHQYFLDSDYGFWQNYENINLTLEENIDTFIFTTIKELSIELIIRSLTTFIVNQNRITVK